MIPPVERINETWRSSRLGRRSICADPRGHVQATGIDAAGRKQYRYHDDWRAHRDREKFDRMLRFARRLPKLRKRIESGLGERGLVQGRVAAAVSLLDLGLFRIGSERYEDENESWPDDAEDPPPA